MAWALSSSVLRCHGRRLLGLCRSAPLVALAALAALVASPWPLARAGGELGRAIGPALSGSGVTHAIVVGLALAGAAGGAAFAVSCPGRPGLGSQLAAGPVSSAAAIAAIALVPATVGIVAVLPALSAFLLSFAAETAGGPAAGAALCLAPLTAASAAAVVAEAALQAGRGRRHALLVAAGAGAAWIVAGSAFHEPAFGPLGPVVGTIAGDEPVVAALASEGLAGVILTTGWLALASGRPGLRPRTRRHTIRLVVRPGGAAVTGAVAALVARRGDIRLAWLAAAVFGIGGVAVGTLSSAPPPAPLLLGATSALLGAALAPLALPGALFDGRWAWATAPRRSLPAVVAAALGLAALLSALVPTIAAALIASSAVTGSLPALALIAVLTAAVALVAGVVVPWRGKGVGDQLTSFGAFAACGGAVSVATGLAGPRLVAAGIPASLAAALIASVLVALSVGALGVGIGRAR